MRNLKRSHRNTTRLHAKWRRIVPWLGIPLTVFNACGKTQVGVKQEDKNVDTISSASQNQDCYREGEIREYEGEVLDPTVSDYDNSIAGAQVVDLAAYSLKIEGKVGNTFALDIDQIKQRETQIRKITLHCIEGWSTTILWQGIRVMELLEEANVAEEGKVVVFHSVDGYTTSLPLATVKQKDLILAYGANGLDLTEQGGYPLRLVAEDKLGYKWARWVDGIEISDDLEYLGYWEQYGYDNGADVPAWQLEKEKDGTWSWIDEDAQ